MPPSVQKCETYRAYISAADKEEASAGDLNAGMLAELKGGGSCGEDSAPSLPEDADIDGIELDEADDGADIPRDE